MHRRSASRGGRENRADRVRLVRTVLRATCFFARRLQDIESDTGDDRLRHRLIDYARVSKADA